MRANGGTETMAIVRTQDGSQCYGQHQERQGQHRVHDSHDDFIEPAAAVTGDHAQRAADEGGHENAGQTHAQ